MNPFALALEALPRWYDLAFEENATRTIVVRTHPHVRDRMLNELMREDHAVASYVEAFGFGAYVPPSELRGWGFPQHGNRSSGEPIGTDVRGWNLWRFPLPHIGLGGREHPDWHSAYALSATLSVFFSALDGMRGVRPEDLGNARQLMRVSMSVMKRSCYGAPISATLSQEALRRLPPAETPLAFPDIGRAMRLACERLWGEALDDDAIARHFEAYLEPPDQLHLRMPLGNAVGLDPEWNGRLPGYGYDLVCHNTDMPLHQLTLLAGLARLHEILDPDT
ncbi:MAG: hypothetical protein QY323_05105 [Patescibacteria group bacterium]|nr:MAG: hypothetical protein QY323_05105 [Patescibacteria group bacterium]